MRADHTNSGGGYTVLLALCISSQCVLVMVIETQNSVQQSSRSHLSLATKSASSLNFLPSSVFFNAFRHEIGLVEVGK